MEWILFAFFSHSLCVLLLLLLGSIVIITQMPIPHHCLFFLFFSYKLYVCVRLFRFQNRCSCLVWCKCSEFILELSQTESYFTTKRKNRKQKHAPHTKREKIFFASNGLYFVWMVLCVCALAHAHIRNNSI